MGKKGKGKKFTVKSTDCLRIEAGTTDYENFRAFYYTLNFWVSTTDDEPLKVGRKLVKEIKSFVYDIIDRNIVKEQFIMVDTVPTTGFVNGYGFISVEFTFFLEGNFHLSIIENRCDRMTLALDNMLNEKENIQIKCGKSSVL